MTARSARRALRRSGAHEAMTEEINRLRFHNEALAMFLRGAIRAHGGLGDDPRLVIARPLLEGPRQEITAMSYEDRIVLTLGAVPEPGHREDSLDAVPWTT